MSISKKNRQKSENHLAIKLKLSLTHSLISISFAESYCKNKVFIDSTDTQKQKEKGGLICLELTKLSSLAD